MLDANDPLGLVRHETQTNKQTSSKTVIYCWIPSHIGIYGNEKVDKNATESLNLDQTDFKNTF